VAERRLAGKGATVVRARVPEGREGRRLDAGAPASALLLGKDGAALLWRDASEPHVLDAAEALLSR
jgi:hypothetical protein